MELLSADSFPEAMYYWKLAAHNIQASLLTRWLGSTGEGPCSGLSLLLHWRRQHAAQANASQPPNFAARQRPLQLVLSPLQVTPDITLSGLDQGPAVLALDGQPSLRTCPELSLAMQACHSGLLGPGSLQAVLQAVLPPAAPLRQLSMTACAVAEQTFEGCTQVATVTWLELTDVYAVAVSFGGLQVNPVYSVGRMLAQMPALQRLCFHRCDMLAGLPSTVTGLTQLRELRAWHCNVRDIPAGPYLSGTLRIGGVGGSVGGSIVQNILA